ncbi:MAG: OmpA family protein [Candidatus Kapabacteria bacterium]|nr:OmpA family protein [Candidatus Kapabacteria bacterium]
MFFLMTDLKLNLIDIFRLRNNFVLLFLFFLFSFNYLFSEDKYGITLGGSYNKHLVDFSHLPEIPSCCPKYSSGDGLGFFVSVFYSYHIADFFNIQSDLGFQTSSSKFLYEEIKPVRVGNEVKDGSFEHSIDLGMNSAYFAPTAYLSLIDNFRFGTGLWLAYTFSEKVIQKEQILKPDGIIYENGKRIRDEYSGSLPDFIPFRLAFTINLDYELPFSIAKNFHLIPRFSYYYDVIPLVKNYDWSTHYLNFSVSIYYKPEKIEPEIRKESIIEIDTLIFKNRNIKDSLFVFGKTITNIETIEGKNFKTTIERIKRTDTLFLPEKTELIAKIQTFALYPDETRKKVFSIRIIENFARSVVPLLPFIFFDKYSSEIDDKYKAYDNQSQSVEFFDPVFLNRHIFNILADRIKQQPNSKIKLFGYSDKTSEKADCQIAKERAVAVRNYFVSNFNLDSSLFEIVTSKINCEPKYPTLSQNEDGFYENRRVEIEPDNPELLKPISIITKLNSPQTDPPALEFDPEGTSTENVKDWKLEVFQKNKILLSYSGKGIPKKIVQPVDSNLAEIITGDASLQVKLTVWNDLGDSAISYDSQKVEKDTSDKILERYSVALFKVSKDILRDVDKIGIREFANKINNGDTISITGFTDYLGFPSDNIKLSQNRADAVYQYLEKILKEKKISVIIEKCQGVADNFYPSNIHSYSTPEERYLSRTVQIEIKKAK